MNARIVAACVVLASMAAGTMTCLGAGAPRPALAWNKALAAEYLDQRQTWWQSWPKAQRDHSTVCVSCHTAVPYALARPVLRGQLGETEFAAPERVLFDDLARRVTLWDEVEPFYTDGKSGPNKSVESRDTEAVLNALILASYDSRRNELTGLTLSAFRNMWALQRLTGDKAGSWVWLNFHNGPWESDVSEYWGATTAALAVSMAPRGYKNDPSIQNNLKLLRSYLRREYAGQPLLNQVVLLWASAKFPGVLNSTDRAALLKSVSATQQSDGGWSLTSLGSWKRRDNTPLETASDGVATGLVVLALEENGIRRLPQVRRGLTWLVRSQNRSQGFWPAWSLNKAHNAPSDDAAHFMSDAATGYAVLALEAAH